MAPSSGAGKASVPTSNKRKPEAPAGNARSETVQQKRAKFHAARTIPAQPADAALKDGELDLQAFVAAHEFEIRSLEQSMAASKTVSTSRAFQKVPRGLRRRTASHNPKRVPRRLRGRATRELNDDNAKVVEARRRKPRTSRARIRAETAKKLGVLAARKRKRRLELAKTAGADSKDAKRDAGVVGRTPRPKIRRNQLNEPPKPAAKFRKRQINKTWLPTHPWLAKRARMTEPNEPLWRFAIPMTPNEKIYRPTHRVQGDRGAIAWDMSYMSTIGLYGNSVGLERVLRRIGVSQESCWNDKGRKWRMGVRAWTGPLVREDNVKRGMCLSTIIWNPEAAETAAIEPKKNQRQVFLRVHPSAFLEVFNELLRLTKMENPRLWIEDLRFEMGSIEITGPASTETLLAVLTPYAMKDKSSKQADVFTSLAGLTNPASLPANAVLAFEAQDPRLRYPPRKVTPSEDPQAEMDLLDLISEWPVEEGLVPYSIFDRNARHRASCLPSQKSINRRRSAKEPGTTLAPANADPPIPILLHASRSGPGTQTQGTWTLVAPWKCILPLWYSIVHCPLSSGGNPRFGGLNELMQVAFERGLPWFPVDFLGTDAGVEWELEQRRKRRWAWARRPKSKRVEWASLDLGAGRKGEVGDGLACDFELLFGLPSDREDAAGPEGDSADAMDIDKTESPATKQASTASLKRLHHIPKADFNNLLVPSNMPPPTLPNAIINVRITLLARGVVNPCARVYRLPSTPTAVPTSSNAEVPSTIPPETSSSPALPQDLRAQWLARIPSSTASTKSHKANQRLTMEARKRLIAKELLAPPVPYPAPAPNQVDIGGHPLVPDAHDLAGFVTTGSFNLAEGRGVAMACLAAHKVLPDVRTGAKEGRLCVVRNAGENVGWIARWEAV